MDTLKRYGFTTHWVNYVYLNMLELNRYYESIGIVDALLGLDSEQVHDPIPESVRLEKYYYSGRCGELSLKE